MELFHIPLREIRERFTTSEIVILAWRSQEQVYHMRRRFKDVKGPNVRRNEDLIPEGMPDRLFNEKGELDIRKMTGDEAWRYFAAQGVDLPVYQRSATSSHGKAKQN